MAAGAGGRGEPTPAAAGITAAALGALGRGRCRGVSSGLEAAALHGGGGRPLPSAAGSSTRHPASRPAGKPAAGRRSLSGYRAGGAGMRRVALRLLLLLGMLLPQW